MKTFITVIFLLLPHLLQAAPDVSVERRPVHADALTYRVAELMRVPATQDEPLTVILQSDNFTGPLRRLITAHRGVVRYQRGRSTEIRIETRHLAQLLKRLPEDVYLRLPYPHQAVAVSEGVELTGAGDMHALQQGGAGVKIGVIDLGFSNYQSAQAVGDLPDSLSITDYSGNGTGGTSHGTSVAEIVHDMAPEAELYLAKVSTTVQLEAAMDDMLAAGVDIINHSVAWFGAAFYDGTGDICSITDSAYSSGMLWVNAMGNSRTAHYLQTFSDTDGDLRHDFSTGSMQNYNTISLTANKSVSLILNWDAYPTTRDVDYNLYLYDHIPGSGSVPVASSENPQRRPYNIAPLEIINYLPTTTGTHYIVVTKAGSSSADIPFTLFSNGPSLSVRTISSSMPQPADCHSVLSVGAVNLTDAAEYFSSEGPTTDGRNKPEISAPNRVQTSLSSSFAGTSASSPHVAGAAALLRAQNTSLSAVQLRDTLIATANDVAASGYDLRTGFGRISLDADSDGFNHDTDNCTLLANNDQLDTDLDLQGNVCDMDDDNDGLADSLEIQIGTDTLLVDTDADGLSDYFEVAFDGNALSYIEGSDLNPLDSDTDHDNLSDYVEVGFDGDASAYMPGLDLDPLLSDTDNDGLQDDIDVLPLNFNYADADIAPLGSPDGQVNVADFVVYQRILRNEISPSAQLISHGDVYPPGSPDGVIDLSDFILMRSLLMQ